MSEHDTFEKIRNDIHSNDVVLYMKGSSRFPQCGFSAAVVDILEKLGIDYKSINVLKDDAVRQGIKAFSDWPTIPQLYVKGEFVGGCDIVKEMSESGELRTFLEEKNIALYGS